MTRKEMSRARKQPSKYQFNHYNHSGNFEVIFRSKDIPGYFWCPGRVTSYTHNVSYLQEKVHIVSRLRIIMIVPYMSTI